MQNIDTDYYLTIISLLPLGPAASLHNTTSQHGAIFTMGRSRENKEFLYCIAPLKRETSPTHLVRELLVADLHGHQLVVDPPSVYRLLQVGLQPLIFDYGLGWILSIIYPLLLIDCG